jgi:trans-aconitate methyltransferase
MDRQLCGLDKEVTWKFDADIAKVFVDHARQHIPNYDRVIDKSVDLCRHFLSTDSKIIDVGCATGETLSRLHQAGFTNLHGVDSSQDMLNHVPDIATYTCSETLPPDQYRAVLCNWTLHFVKNKYSYIQNIYKNLEPGGFLLLTEKTSLDPTAIHFYHEFKARQGVSAQQIIDKARSVESIMYIDQPEWYMKYIKLIGFQNTHIIDADWCFTSFLCFK